MKAFQGRGEALNHVQNVRRLLWAVLGLAGSKLMEQGLFMLTGLWKNRARRRGAIDSGVHVEVSRSPDRRRIRIL